MLLLSLSVTLWLYLSRSDKEQWSWSQEGVALVASPAEPELIWRIIIIQLANKVILLPRAVRCKRKIMHKRDVRDRKEGRQGQAEGDSRQARHEVSPNVALWMSCLSRDYKINVHALLILV